MSLFVYIQYRWLLCWNWFIALFYLLNNYNITWKFYILLLDIVLEIRLFVCPVNFSEKHVGLLYMNLVKWWLYARGRWYWFRTGKTKVIIRVSRDVAFFVRSLIWIQFSPWNYYQRFLWTLKFCSESLNHEDKILLYYSHIINK